MVGDECDGKKSEEYKKLLDTNLMVLNLGFELMEVEDSTLLTRDTSQVELKFLPSNLVHEFLNKYFNFFTVVTS